jgi:dTDP-4-dehydrorhamnose 3,5-epimerase
MLRVDFSDIEGLKLIEAVTHNDMRGSFTKYHPSLYLRENLSSVAISYNPKLGTIRGLHLQIEPFAEEKLISCIQGSIFDVLLDLRPNSPSFGKFAAIELNQENNLQVYLPKGIAHGFQSLAPNSIVQYILTSKYAPECSISINPLRDLEINWPVADFIISEKDSLGMSLMNAAKKYADSLEI